MPLTKGYNNLSDSGKFVTVLQKVERHFIGVPRHPHKMPFPEMLSRLVEVYRGNRRLYQSITGTFQGQVVRAHWVAFKMMERILKEQIVPGESLLETLASSVRVGGADISTRLFNLAVLHIITFPLFHVYSLVPEYIYAGQKVRGKLTHTGGRRYTKGPSIERYIHWWNERYGAQVVRAGKVGVVESLTFYKWFLRFFQGRKFSSHQEYLDFLGNPSNSDVLNRVKIASLQFLSVSRLVPEGGLEPPKKRIRDKEL